MEIARALPLAAGHGPVVPGWGESPAADLGPDTPPAEPGGHVDNARENAGAQVVGRPPPPVVEPHNTDDALPTSHSVDSEFVAPAALLVPHEMVGLQAERAEAWSLAWRGFDPQALRIDPDPVEPDDDAPKRAGRDRSDGGEPRQDEGGDESDEDAACAGSAAVETGATAEAAGAVAAWAEPLSQVLDGCLGSAAPPLALLTAAEQWRRGRCVALACPRDEVAGIAGWAFVLWPRSRPASRGVARSPRLDLHGLRVTSHLQWIAPPKGDGWLQAKVLKEHHPRAGRQLVTPGDRGPASGASPVGHVPCELQLGPVLPPRPRPCDVRVRVGAAWRFWAALGSQWSLQLIVCTQPLLAASTEFTEVNR